MLIYMVSLHEIAEEEQHKEDNVQLERTTALLMQSDRLWTEDKKRVKAVYSGGG